MKNYAFSLVHFERYSIALHRTRSVMCCNNAGVAPSSAHGYVFIGTLVTRAQYALGLSVCVRLYVCVCR